MVLKSGKNKRFSHAREMRKASILRLLDDKGPHSFSKLEKITQLFPGTLNAVLLDLEGDNKIERIAHEGKMAYAITKKGRGTILELGIIGFEASEVMQQGGAYFEDYSNWRGTMYLYDLPWGMQDDLILDKNLKKQNPITKKTVSELHTLLYRCIKEDVKKRRIRLDETKDGKVILGFNIDYKDLVESIKEQSMDYLEIMSDKEEKLWGKIEDGTLRKGEKDELDKLRQRTRVKLRRITK